MHPPLADPTASGARKVTSEIQKNRGLTPHRRKDLKNPRKHARVKFAAAEKRRKGAVVSVRKPEGPYGGEATGIKTKVSRSVRFG
jgi:U3 small nucleolar RNA-associated protein 3